MSNDARSETRCIATDCRKPLLAEKVVALSAGEIVRCWSCEAKARDRVAAYRAMKAFA